MSDPTPDLSPDPRAKRASLGLKIIIGVVAAVVIIGAVWRLVAGDRPGGSWAWQPSPPYPNAGGAPAVPNGTQPGPPIQQLQPSGR